MVSGIIARLNFVRAQVCLRYYGNTVNHQTKSLVAAIFLAATMPMAGQNSRTNAIIRAEPLAGGRIEPTLFGNFMELLDDVVPGSWAELTGVFASASLSQSGLSTRKNMQYNF